MSPLPSIGARPHRLREILEVDLVADAGAGRHHAEVVERFLPPAQELVALAVALVLELDVLPERQRRAETVDHHRVVDHEIDRHQRVDLLRVGAELGRRIAHRGEIDHRRNAGKVLHQHPRRAIVDLVLGDPRLEPLGDRENIRPRHRAPVLEAEEVLENHLHRDRQRRDPGKAVLFRLRQREVRVGPVPHGERRAGLEAVERYIGQWGRLLLAVARNRWRGGANLGTSPIYARLIDNQVAACQPP